jgi:hypothetical protein
METESSPRNVFWKINRTVFLDKDRTMDNIQKHNIFQYNMFPNIYYLSHFCSKSMKLLFPCTLLLLRSHHTFRIIFHSDKYSSTLKKWCVVNYYSKLTGMIEKSFIFFTILGIFPDSHLILFLNWKDHSRICLKISVSHIDIRTNIISSPSSDDNVSPTWSKSVSLLSSVSGT